MKIGLREVRALKANEEVWDAAVQGFGARRQNSDAISYILLYRTTSGRSRRYTIGRHGSPWTPDTARDEAKRLLGEVVQGNDPAADKQTARRVTTVSELCVAYLADAEAGAVLTRRGEPKKASTLLTDKSRIDAHIKPILGAFSVKAVERADIETMIRTISEGKMAGRKATGRKHGLSNIRGGRGAASRSVGLLGAIFSYAVQHRMRPDNPVRGVIRPADGRRTRRLSDEEYAALGAGLRAAENAKVWPPAIACTRFLVLTGWRSGEALSLRGTDVDLSRRTATLGDTKTGGSLRPLSNQACDVLKAGRGGNKTLAFPASRGPGQMTGYRKFWNRVLGLAELPSDITPHVLRHSFASLASDLGYSEPTIGALIGHKGQTMTSRYVHSADAVLLAAADAVARKTAELMGDAKAGEVVPLRREA